MQPNPTSSYSTQSAFFLCTMISRMGHLAFARVLLKIRNKGHIQDFFPDRA